MKFTLDKVFNKKIAVVAILALIGTISVASAQEKKDSNNLINCVECIDQGKNWDESKKNCVSSEGAFLTSTIQGCVSLRLALVS